MLNYRFFHVRFPKGGYSTTMDFSLVSAELGIDYVALIGALNTSVESHSMRIPYTMPAGV
jgi:hypothetical protein